MSNANGVGTVSPNFGAGAWSPLQLGASLKYWILATKGITLGIGTNIVEWDDQTTNAQNYVAINPNIDNPSELIDAKGRPYANFDGSKTLFTATNSLATGAKTIISVFQLNNLPGVGNEVVLTSKYTSGTEGTEIGFANLGVGYQPIIWIFDVVAGNSAGIAVPLDTNIHRMIIQFNGVDGSAASSYTCNYDGVNVAVVGTGAYGMAANGKNSLGSRISSTFGISIGMNGRIYESQGIQGLLSPTNLAHEVQYLANKYS
jgi:hypothetical protein